MNDTLAKAAAGTEPCGVLNLYKPQGCTSFDCVARVRRLYGTKKVGHAGTLDPMAEGVLPILVGKAAKAAEYLTEKDKCYEAVLRLGFCTDTQDISGTVTKRFDRVAPPEAVYAAAQSFAGQSMQCPPMYSALKVGGKKLCDLARQGITAERTARPITIYSISATQLSQTDFSLRVHCSKGTYIRTLCEDIGNALGCGGVMAALRRTQSGPFSERESICFQALEAMSPAQRCALLLPTEHLFLQYPAVRLPAFFERLCRAGLAVSLKKLGLALPNGAYVRLCDASGSFFALGQAVVGTNEDPEAPALKPCKQF